MLSSTSNISSKSSSLSKNLQTKMLRMASSFSSTISFNVPQIIGDTDLLLVSGFRVGYSIGEQINKQHLLMLAVDAIYQQIISHKVSTPKAHSLHGLVFHYIQNRR